MIWSSARSLVMPLLRCRPTTLRLGRKSSGTGLLASSLWLAFGPNEPKKRPRRWGSKRGSITPTWESSKRKQKPAKLGEKARSQRTWPKWGSKWGSIPLKRKKPLPFRFGRGRNDYDFFVGDAGFEPATSTV